MENLLESCVPPGFRFHPTEEELVGYYLKRKVNSLKIDLDVIIDIDLYRIEPWDLQDRCKLGYEEQNEWYFFSHKDRKYPTGTRTNRATAAGFWKATGRDKAILSKEKIIGMRKTLVFYKGRAPNGAKSDWIMHEYRLQTSQNGPPQEEGWVVCRAFKKLSPTHKQGYESWNNSYYARSDSCSSSHYGLPSFPNSLNSPTININQDLIHHGAANLDHHDHHHPPFPSHDCLIKSTSHMFELPKLDSPSISTSFTTNDNNLEEDQETMMNGWKRFDKLLDCEAIEPSSFAYTNMGLVPHNDHHELDDHAHISHVLECFQYDL